MGANDDTLSGLVGLDNNNGAGGAGANNDTKMSDNEAFLAYMSKAEAGDDDGRVWRRRKGSVATPQRIARNAAPVRIAGIAKTCDEGGTRRNREIHI